MAKRLTEEMVIARTKISDLGKIKRLNCWGSELVDVSLLRKMPSVEVLSLSINKINTLADFQFCKRLEELYIRQNEIREISDVVYLQNLPNLKNLWLSENPCANSEGYRLAVIKSLPQLQKLDNVQITPEEYRDAQRRGATLRHPDEEEEEVEAVEASDDDCAPGRGQVSPPRQRYGGYAEEEEIEYVPTERSPVRIETPDPEEAEEIEDVYPREDVSEESREFSPPRQTTPPRRRMIYSPEPEYVERRRNSYERESPRQQQYYEKSSSTNQSLEEVLPCETVFRETKIVNSQSASCIKEYANGERYVPSHGGSEVSVSTAHEKRERYTCPAAVHRPPFTRRPVTRNSNILSAVLCLVKELDYPSLEVVEMAVRCRMDELDE
ncbi:unnamed protein product [Phaedon cochleariae]|uniref:U2A'/phosphoprotein 32 family A C-terminal domain-containing protein n=1 Tax=Phaedon cochleariae TaxID=80249 RepID=A0A9N9S942_PHACE|nr:unnamed protein product [Phaedon cochleariae]